MSKLGIFTSIFASLAFIFMPGGSLLAQTLHEDYQATWKARVLEVVEEDEREIPGTGTTHTFQILRAEILEGPRAGEEIAFENDFITLDEGDRFFMNYLVSVGGEEIFAVVNLDRTNQIFLLVAVFVIAVLAFGGWQGLRSLIALAGSFLAIFYILFPGLLGGWNPLLASFLVAAGVLFAAIFFTHGFNRESAVAYAGTIIAVILTGVFAVIAVDAASLSGFATDDSVYLNFSTGGALDFTGLLLGAIIIGVLGVLDDIAVTQSAVVSELYASNPSASKKEVFARAIRVGREHVGALVNTLVLAYTGAALPLLLLFYTSPAGFSSIINMEIFATEIVRTIAGSIGLILAVPIVTGLAVHFLKGYSRPGSHSHHHGH